MNKIATIPQSVLELHTFCDKHIPNLTVIRLEPGYNSNEAAAVATDGHRLCSVRFTHTGDLDEPIHIPADLAKRALAGVKKKDRDAIGLVHADGVLRLLPPGGSLDSPDPEKPISYPPWQRVEPTAREHSATPFGLDVAYLWGFGAYLKRLGLDTKIQCVKGAGDDSRSPMVWVPQGPTMEDIRYILMPCNA